MNARFKKTKAYSVENLYTRVGKFNSGEDLSPLGKFISLRWKSVRNL